MIARDIRERESTYILEKLEMGDEIPNEIVVQIRAHQVSPCC